MKKWVAGFAAVLAFSIAVSVRSQSPAEQGRAPRDAPSAANRATVCGPRPMLTVPSRCS